MSKPVLVAPEQAVSRRVMFEGRISRVVDYFGGASPFGGPQAYLVEQKNYVLRPHFHPVDQFQVLLGAPGSIFGRRPIGELVVHYADAFTVYGPLVGTEPPLRYFTLRAEPTNKTEFMPESRARLPGRPGRSLHGDVTSHRLVGSGEPEVRSSTLLEDPRDGMRAGWLAGPADAELTVPPAGPNGQFVFVAAGTVMSEGASFPTESIGWQPPDAPVWTVRAEAGGAVVLVLRYPVRAERAGGGGDA